eukprot:TRINITY_DN37886_c0_g1_i1.p2 TRINITY_DN37886_c0_g1~~TRINITY_DN37886_c0_g1_i1.p2  ORF type:complete len:124 (-),score=34.93 TRINITY_DN37886_c0_g1_i1:20-391(-)
MDAHRVMEWCKKTAPEKHDALMEVMFQRYFQDAVDLTKHEVLVSIVKEVEGLDADACMAMLSSPDMKSEVKSKVKRAAEMNVSGVPFFIVEPRAGAKKTRPVAFSGAQPASVIEEILQDAAGT